ncbi:stage V sporulation protein S [Streptosporangium sp. NPDC023825]|uniref:stage V sporulation protein S n=1 Tax=Streptosporangium sp. NPDC023825 TaxID=3154909 RepID=UPI0034242999
MDDNTALLKVRASSDATRLASAISHALYDGKEVSLRSIGAGAVNQSVKALAIAQSYVGSKGLSLTCRPGFTSVTMDDGETVTAILFKVYSQ